MLASAVYVFNASLTAPADHVGRSPPSKVQNAPVMPKRVQLQTSFKMFYDMHS